MRTNPSFFKHLAATTAVTALIGLTGGVALGAPDAVVRTSPSEQRHAVAFEQGPPTTTHPAPVVTPLAREATKPQPEVLAHVEHGMRITARPGEGRVVGRMPAGSRFYGERHVAWVMRKSSNGRFGKVPVPYSGTRATGWIKLSNLRLTETPYTVTADLSDHVLRVKRLDKIVMVIPAATGASASPTPVGRYFVTDRVAIPGGGYLGTFAFGISGIQTNLPAGWTGGDQLAIHGTNDPGSIGQSTSAGCLRVSERALSHLKPLLRLGTPVTVQR